MAQNQDNVQGVLDGSKNKPSSEQSNVRSNQIMKQSARRGDGKKPSPDETTSQADRQKKRRLNHNSQQPASSAEETSPTPFKKKKCWILFRVDNSPDDICFNVSFTQRDFFQSVPMVDGVDSSKPGAVVWTVIHTDCQPYGLYNTKTEADEDINNLILERAKKNAVDFKSIEEVLNVYEDSLTSVTSRVVSTD